MKPILNSLVCCLVLSFTILTGCSRSEQPASSPPVTKTSVEPSAAKSEPLITPALSPIATAALHQVGKTVTYDPAYVGLSYPDGDLPMDRGVCTDVVIRALRDAFKLDLQKLVHEDMNKYFSKYPTKWGLKRTDKNIDHRRVPNLRRYFERQGWSIEVTSIPADYLAGDLVTCTVGGKLAHIMVVSNKNNQKGTPFIIHNIGSGTLEEDRLFEFPITGHYRVWKLP